MDRFEQLKDEVRAYDRKIVEVTGVDREISALYKGTQLLFSPVMINPTFLLMGINPGAGYMNSCGERVEQIEPMDELEYFSCNYTLAAETKIAFERAGLTELLKSSAVKSNVWYWATKDSTSLWNVVGKLCSYDIPDPETTAMEWTARLVSLLAPKVIICEGATALAELSKAITGKKKRMNGSTVLKTHIGEYTVIAYSRRRDSGIKDIDELASVLKATYAELIQQ